MTESLKKPFMVKEISSIEDYYTIVEDIGKGTYATVQKCIEKATNKPVALKAIKKVTEEDGFTKTTLREIQLLQKLNHENIVRLYCVLCCKGTIYLVLEYCEYDLSALLHRQHVPRLSDRFIKSIQFQLMVSLQYLDTQRVIHRDLKPSNMFITANNVLKLGDFGLARERMANPRYSYKVITQWYRPPELLLQNTSYGIEVDIWSAACIYYELIMKEPLFYTRDTNSEPAQLKTIIKICGFPEESYFQKHDLFRNLDRHAFPPPNNLKNHLQQKFPREFYNLIPLLLAMLRYDPAKRPKPLAILEHPYFKEHANFYDYLNPYKLDKINLPEMHGSASRSEKERAKEREKGKEKEKEKEKEKDKEKNKEKTEHDKEKEEKEQKHEQPQQKQEEKPQPDNIPRPELPKLQ